MSLAGLTPEDISSAFGVAKAITSEKEKVPYTDANGVTYNISADLAAQLDAGKYKEKQVQVPYTTADGRQIMVDPDTAARLDAEKNKEKTSSDIAEFEYAKKYNGYTGTLEDWLVRQKKAGATNIDLSTRKDIEHKYDIMYQFREKSFDDQVSNELKNMSIEEKTKIEELRAKDPAAAEIEMSKLRVGIMDKRIKGAFPDAIRANGPQGKGWYLPEGTLIRGY